MKQHRIDRDGLVRAERITRQQRARRAQMGIYWTGALSGLDIIADYLRQGKGMDEALRLAKETALQQLEKAVAE